MSELDVDEIINELAKGRSHNQVVTKLCERSGHKWEYVSELVRYVEVTHAQEIAKRRFPFLAIFSSAIVLVGILLAGQSVYSVVIGEKIPLTLDILYFAYHFQEGGQLIPFGYGLFAILIGAVGYFRALRDTRD